MIIGHQRILNFLKKSVENKKISHAYLFLGPENVGKTKVALEFAKIIEGVDIEKGIHPDIMVIEPERTIGINEIRKIRHSLSLHPYQAPYRIVLVSRAEKMTEEASNALLKTLEEPLGKAVLILTTSIPEALPLTIKSRCEVVRFSPVPLVEIEDYLLSEGRSKQQAHEIARFSLGRPGIAIRFLEDRALFWEEKRLIQEVSTIISADLTDRYQYVEKFSKNPKNIPRTLNAWIILFRDLLLAAQGCENLVINISQLRDIVRLSSQYPVKKIKEIIYLIERTKFLISTTNVNPRLAMEVLMLEL